MMEIAVYLGCCVDYQDVIHPVGHLRSVLLAACTSYLSKVGRGSEREPDTGEKQNKIKLSFTWTRANTQRQCKYVYALGSLGTGTVLHREPYTLDPFQWVSSNLIMRKVFPVFIFFSFGLHYENAHPCLKREGTETPIPNFTLIRIQDKLFVVDIFRFHFLPRFSSGAETRKEMTLSSSLASHIGPLDLNLVFDLIAEKKFFYNKK